MFECDTSASLFIYLSSSKSLSISVVAVGCAKAKHHKQSIAKQQASTAAIELCVGMRVKRSPSLSEFTSVVARERATSASGFFKKKEIPVSLLDVPANGQCR